MNNRPWLFILSGVLVTPFFVFIAMMFAGGGHGTYVPGKILFPFSMTLTMFTGEITTPILILAFAQYPIDGLCLAWSAKVGQAKRLGSSFMIIHAIAIAAAFTFSAGTFS